MDFTFHIQDPSDPHTTYLYEALIQELMAPSIVHWGGIYAFATGAGVRSLLVDEPVASSFLEEGSTEFIVGVDAVTDVSALEELQALESQHAKFTARVYINPGTGLFHPKLSRFISRDGSAALLIGSGNLTPGGLRHNTEAYAISRGSARELSSMCIWDEWVARHAEDIRPIDAEALEMARQNMRRRPRRQAGAAPPEEEAEPDTEATPIPRPSPETAQAPVLVAIVPRAGDRWNQIHYNAEIIRRFFRIARSSSQRAFLTEVHPDGGVEPEEQRPLVYSAGSNRNLKIEVAARRGREYPPEGTPPIIVLKETGTRMFRYMLLFPGDEAYSRVAAFLRSQPSIGKGVHRAITTYSALKAAWPSTPL